METSYSNEIRAGVSYVPSYNKQNIRHALVLSINTHGSRLPEVLEVCNVFMKLFFFFYCIAAFIS